MDVRVVNQDRKSWLLEAPDGRRYVISGGDDAKVSPEGSSAPMFGGPGLSYKAARRLLEELLSKELAA